MKAFAISTVLLLSFVLILLHQYGMLLVSILISAFYIIVVRSNRFPRLSRFFEEAF